MNIFYVKVNNYLFLRDKLPLSMKMLVFFLEKCVRNAVKTMVVDTKNQKALALLYLASKPLRKAANSSGVPTEFKQNRQGETFFPLTNLFLTFVVFACFATTRVNMRFRAKNTWDSAQGYIQCMKCIGNPVVRTYVRTVT